MPDPKPAFLQYNPYGPDPNAPNPFTEQLTKPFQPAPEPPQPYGGQSGAATGLMIAENFLKGMTDSRKQAYIRDQDERQQKVRGFTARLSELYKNPDLTDEAKQALDKQANEVIWGDVARESEKHAKGNRVVGIFHDLALGATGGKFPKGGKDIKDPDAEAQRIWRGFHDEQGRLKPEFSKQSQLQEIQGKWGESLKGMSPESTSREQALQSSVPYLMQLHKIDPERARIIAEGTLAPYRPQPTTTADFAFQQLQAPHPAAAPPPGAPPAPAAGVPESVPANVRGLMDAPPGPPPAAAPQAPAFDPMRANLWYMAERKDFPKPQAVEFIDKDGKVTRGAAIWVSTPENPGLWIYPDTKKEITDKTVRPGSAAPERQLQYDKFHGPAPSDTKLPDGTLVKKGQDIWYRQAKEPGAKPEPVGFFSYSSREPQPRASWRDHPNVVAAQRKMDAAAAISKIIEQTPEPPDGTNYADWIWQHADKYYLHPEKGKPDSSVAPYAKEIRDWVVDIKKKGTSKADILKSLMQNTQQAKEEHREAKGDAQADLFSQQVQEMIGMPGRAHRQTDIPDQEQ